MGKKLLLSLLATFVGLVPLSPVSAATDLTSSQKHYYTVQMRSDEQSITYAKIIFENSSADAELKTYEFSLPEGVKAENVSVQQVFAKLQGKRICKTYETMDEWQSRTNRLQSLSPASSNTYESTRLCLTYDTAAVYDEDYDFESNMSSSTEYYSYTYYTKRSSIFEYKDLTPTVNGQKYTVELGTAIKPKKQGAVLVSFTSKDFISGFLGRYTYNYRTLLTNQLIDTATVAISFDEELYSREAKQQRTSESSSPAGDTVALGAASAGYSSKSVDSAWLAAGQGGTIVKTQSKMLPGDTMSVKGVFATSPLMLYLPETLITLGVIALAIVGSIFGYRRYRSKHPRVVKEKISANESGNSPTTKGNFATGDGFMTAGRMAAVTAISIGATVVSYIILAMAFGPMQDTASSSDGTTILLWLIGSIIVTLFCLVICPLLYTRRYANTSVFIWSIVQFVSILVLLLLFSFVLSLIIGIPDNGGYLSGGMM